MEERAERAIFKRTLRIMRSLHAFRSFNCIVCFGDTLLTSFVLRNLRSLLFLFCSILRETNLHTVQQ